MSITAPLGFTEEASHWRKIKKRGDGILDFVASCHRLGTMPDPKTVSEDDIKRFRACHAGASRLSAARKSKEMKPLHGPRQRDPTTSGLHAQAYLDAFAALPFDRLAPLAASPLLALPEELLLQISTYSAPSRVRNAAEFRSFRLANAVSKTYLRLATAAFWSLFIPTHICWPHQELSNEPLYWDQDWIPASRRAAVAEIRYDVRFSSTTFCGNNGLLARYQLMHVCASYPNLKRVDVVITYVYGRAHQPKWEVYFEMCREDFRKMRLVGRPGQVRKGVELSVSTVEWVHCSCNMFAFVSGG